MTLNKSPLTLSLVVGGILLCLCGGLADVPGRPAWVIVGCLATAASLIVPAGQRPTSPQSDPAPPSIEQERSDFEQWQQAQLELLTREADRLRDKQVDLAQRSARYQEFLEYPIADSTAAEHIVPPADVAAQQIRLTAQDREVHALLEEEAKRVYEAIRNNEYVDDGNVDVERIRNDALTMVRKVARVYAPDSQNPLLETSFEQLARAASRTCLHTLVLLEQLPLDVKSYTINELYTYIRRAVTAYGTYKQAAPWLKRLSRTAYAGRLVAGTNPVTLGAWWLATEVTRRGASKLVENAVDRQAIAVLHDVVTVLGTEVASVYGPGFRQRDPAWVYGSELTELLLAFPMSRESLSQGLQEITRLELRSEYDRIYLYRCLAQRRAAGQRLSDPAMLTRPEREGIAKRLEAFFQNNLHGIQAADRAQWQADVEQRLDLKMQLHDQPLDESHARAAVASVAAFLTHILTVPAEELIPLLEGSQLILAVAVDGRSDLLEGLGDGSVIPEQFHPPDIDPAASLTEQYLHDLYETAVASGRCDDHIEGLLLETGSYFRRPQEESQAKLDACFQQQLQLRRKDGQSCDALHPAVVRTVLQDLKPAQQVTAVYHDVHAQQGKEAHDLADAIACLIDGRLKVFASTTTASAVWESDATTQVRRIRGYVIDDCELTGGHWHTSSHGAIRLPGTLTGGGFQKRFAPILAAFPASTDS